MLQKQNINKAIKDIIIIVVGVVVVWFGLRLVFATDNPFYVVSSESMVPTLNVYDVIIVRDGSTFDELKVGDIIVFHSPSEYDRVIVHRIAKIQGSSEKIITTKGDNNPSSIPGIDYPITKKEYIGKVIFVIPKLGVVSKALTPPINYVIIGVILAIIFLSKLNDKGKGKDRESIQSKVDVRSDDTASKDINSKSNKSIDPKGDGKTGMDDKDRDDKGGEDKSLT